VLREGFRLARLSTLKLSMYVTILLVGTVFAVFLGVLMYVISILWELPSLIMYEIAVVGAVFFIFVDYLIGPLFVNQATKLRYLDSGENPWLEQTVKGLADKSGLPMPRVAVVPDETPNAFVFGRTAKGATLAVHEGLLKNLNEGEVEGVIGHEFGHLHHKDYLVMTALAAVPLLAYLIARVSFEAVEHGRIRVRGKGGGLVVVTVVVAAAISYVVYLIAQLCVRRLSRLREQYADAYSAYLTGSPRKLESSLTKITYGLSLSPKNPSGARTFFICDPAQAKLECQDILERKEEFDLDKNGVLDEHELDLAMEKEAQNTWRKINLLFATHPPTYKRILLLREIEKEIDNGKFTSDRIYEHV
jgi:heat shock protein HtpX